MAALIGPARPLDVESDMLPQDPPPWAIRAAARLIIGIFTVALLASIFVKLPETVDCAFILVPKDGGDPIRSPRTALVHSVAVSEGETVTAGSPMIVLRSDEIRSLDAQWRSTQEELRMQEEDLAKFEAAYQSQLEIKQGEIAQAESEVGFRQKHASSSRELVTRMEKLSKSGGISAVELIRLRLSAAESEKDHSVAERTLQQVKLEQKRLEDRLLAAARGEADGIEKLKYRLGALKGDLENSEQDLLTIRAPYDAVVISLAQRSAGTVVQNGQELCQLAPRTRNHAHGSS
jgi:multidrug resistance efflux pump